MTHPLDGVQLKYERAHDHLDTLQSEFDAFTRDAYGIRHDVEREGREHVYRIETLKETPSEWGPIIGDCLHSAASALDHLAFQLAILYTGQLSSDLARDTHFPIYGNSREFWDNLPKLRAIGPNQVAPMERLQPYHGIKGADHHWLMILKRLSNLDKHRTLHTTGYRFGGVAYYRPDNLMGAVYKGGRVVPGAELARFTFNPPDPDVDMDPSFRIRVALKDTPVADGADVWELLNTLCFQVKQVVDSFRPLFS
ncbi:MAG: hypothetical protein M3046_08430 [Actinomycetota bacterium]|nr:hypothetical protein [Actinomycetota bacterium]